MSIIAACNCGQRVKVNDTLAGKQVKCPKCAAPIAIPLAASAAPVQPAAPAPNAGGGAGHVLGDLDLGAGLTPLEQPAGFGAPASPAAYTTAPATYSPSQPGVGQPYPQQQPAMQQPLPQQPYPQQLYPQQPYPQQQFPQQPYPQQHPAPNNPYQAPAYQPAQFPGPYPGQMMPQAPIRGHRPLTPEQRSKYNMLSFALGIPGLLIYLGTGMAANLTRDNPSLAFLPLVGLLVAIVLLGSGLAFSAMYKGYHPALGLLGLFCIVGLIIIALLPDRGAPLSSHSMPQQPQWPGPPR